MARSRSRIALIKRPVNDPVEKHGCRAREYHADDHQQKNSRRRPAVRRHDQRGKSKGERENRMRKTNQPKKSSNRSVSNLSHECNRKLLVPGSTGCQPVVVGSPAGKILRRAAPKLHLITLVSASCRDLQAGSLRSAEAQLAQLLKPTACWSKNAYSPA